MNLLAIGLFFLTALLIVIGIVANWHGLFFTAGCTFTLGWIEKDESKKVGVVTQK